MKFLTTSLFTVLLTIFIAACGGGDTDSSDSSGAGVTNIVTLGDSIGAGWCGTTPWGSRLGASLGVPVTNNSRSGRRTGEGLGLVDGLLASNNPSHLVVLLGTNDARDGDINGAISNMTSIVNKALAAGVTPIIGTLPANFGSSSEDSAAAQISAGYRGISGAIIADIRGALGTNTDYFCDSLHPNDSGQVVITSTFLNAF